MLCKYTYLFVLLDKMIGSIKGPRETPYEGTHKETLFFFKKEKEKYIESWLKDLFRGYLFTWYQVKCKVYSVSFTGTVTDIIVLG